MKSNKQKMEEAWKLDPHFRTEFLDACHHYSLADDETFKTFHLHDRISCVITNTTDQWAKNAMAAMGWLPTTIRYLYTLHLIEKLLGSLENAKIVEIGGGYGGQCEVIVNNYCSLEGYTIYDLPEVTALQNRYLFTKGVQPQFRSDIEAEFPDFVISWCAWGELELDLKKEYVDKIISRAKSIFICSNYTIKEDIDLLAPYFPNLKVYKDDLVDNVIYCKNS